MAQKIDRTIAKAQAECTQSGFRLTEKRRNILHVMLEAGAPLSAYDIADRYKDKYHEALSAMSAYRMLNVLLKAGLAHKLETTNQYLACSHITCAHEHQVPQFLICDRCHSVQEVGLRTQLLDDLKASVESTGFVMNTQQLELHGLCVKCRQHP